MNVVIGPLFAIIDIVLSLYMWAFILSAVLSWLIAFGVINTYNRFVYSVTDFLYRITEPALKPLRKVIPNFGGVDLTPMAAILIIYFIRMVVWELGSGL
ncbi:MAG: hypothetical protein A2516_04670 [Alphaproteobacteria bacterium RIFOXYD12_FULL_60_8]|nr:MAG: hypothetical protein A2516_04670 [Alphaproteobacteria bacterium RIFOXYD12_FULL_60_8]